MDPVGSCNEVIVTFTLADAKPVAQTVIVPVQSDVRIVFAVTLMLVGVVPVEGFVEKALLQSGAEIVVKKLAGPPVDVT
jgi:hypothetical protein